jgi:hypothetical protein
VTDAGSTEAGAVSGAGRVTPAGLLVLSDKSNANAASDVDVVGVAAADGARTPLGRIPPLAGFCGWNTRFLICPTRDGFTQWRFAAG